MTLRDMRAAVVLFLGLAVATGLLYPLAMTGAGQVLFPRQANGSLMRVHGRIMGSMLIGQYLRGPGLFWSRPSATAPVPYDAKASGASNLGPDNPVLRQHVASRVAALRKADPGVRGPVPVDLVTSSGSGLDPDISIAAAHYQVARISRATTIARGQLMALIRRYTVPRSLGFLGEPVVNVVRLDLALWRREGARRPR
ncbi:potassium-transporting ATPase subunit KdpC [Acidiferrobacter sp.]|uniref:potassium-transporting ATPase subunit KdpC n=1 Tax=Acidiferrobacter sp. TaxID=1872107 RepID=UPI00345BA974